MKSAIAPSRSLQAFDRQMRDLPAAIPRKACRLPQHGGRATGDRIRHELAAVCMRPRVRGKRHAGFDAAAVRSDPAREGTQLREERSDVGNPGGIVRGDGGESGQERSGQVSSRISLPCGGRITLLSGASVGTPSMRSAEPVTFENTGAATAPP